MPNTWIIEKSDTHVLVTRRKPVRWDVSAVSEFPACHPLRLAHQIRQDMWRMLQSMRGYSPVVRLTERGQGWHVLAGGRVQGNVPPGTVERISDLLENQTKRGRWVAQAKRAVDKK